MNQSARCNAARRGYFVFGYTTVELAVDETLLMVASSTRGPPPLARGMTCISVRLRGQEFLVSAWKHDQL